MMRNAEEREKRYPVMDGLFDYEQELEDEDVGFRQFLTYGVGFDWLSDASAKALEREDEVKAIFHRAKNDFERTTLASLAKGEKHVMEDLVPPNQHLTAHTWKTFRLWVEEHHRGWKAKRRVATKDEVELFEQEDEGNKCPSRGKSYYISFIYQDPSTINKKNGKKTKKGGDDDDEEEEHQKPPAKKLKATPSCAPENHVVSVSFDSLPELLHVQILSFCDVLTLGAVVPVSKDLCRLAKTDSLWAPHLKKLLRELFDASLESDSTTPPSQRPDWRESTALLRWWQQAYLPAQEAHLRVQQQAGVPFYLRTAGLRKNTVVFLASADASVVRDQSHSQARPQRPRRTNQQRNQERRPENFAFLFNNVPLRDFYHRAGNMALRSTLDLKLGGEFGKFCPDCFYQTWREPSPLFSNLPKIMWGC